MVPTDAEARQALDLMARGDADALLALVTRHARLLRETVDLDPPPPPYFRNPKLLWFVAENPIRNERLPANIDAVAQTLIDAARAQRAPDLETDLTTTLGLVATGHVPRACGVQNALIETLVRAGADPGAPLNGAAAHRERAACEALLALGAPLTGPIAAALGRETELAALLPTMDATARQQALSLAAINGEAGCVRHCLSAGADPNRFNPKGMHAHSTPLHQAVFAGDRDTVAALLDGGADPTLRDALFDGDAAGWAIHSKREGVLDLLRG